MAISIFAQQSLAAWCRIYAEVTEDVTFYTSADLEILMWSKVCANESGVVKQPFRIPYENVKKSKLQLPYLPEDIKYTGCVAIKKNGGLYTPCCGKVKPSEEEGWGGEEFLCVTCKKADLKFGTIETRDEHIENGDFTPITYGDWMKAHKLSLSQVYTTLAENGVSVMIPVKEQAVSQTKKARRGRPGKSDDSVVDDDAEPVKAKKAKKAKAEKADKSESESDEPKVKVVKAKKAKAEKAESEGDTDEPKVKKPKAKSEETSEPKVKKPKAKTEKSESEEPKAKTEKSKSEEPKVKKSKETTEASSDEKESKRLRKEAKAEAKAEEERLAAKAEKKAKKSKKSEDDLVKSMGELELEEGECEKVIVDIDDKEYEQRGDIILTMEGVYAGKIVDGMCDWVDEGRGTNL